MPFKGWQHINKIEYENKPPDDVEQFLLKSAPEDRKDEGVFYHGPDAIDRRDHQHQQHDADEDVFPEGIAVHEL